MAPPILFAALLAGAMSLLAARSAMAHVDVGVQVGAPVYVAPAPVYVAPPRRPWSMRRATTAGMATANWDGRRWYGRSECAGGITNMTIGTTIAITGTVTAATATDPLAG